MSDIVYSAENEGGVSIMSISATISPKNLKENGVVLTGIHDITELLEHNRL